MEIYASLSLALMHSEGSSERVREAFSRALDIAAVQGDLAYELRLLSGLFMYYRWNIDMNAALDIASRSKEVALKTKDHDDLALAEIDVGRRPSFGRKSPRRTKAFRIRSQSLCVRLALPRGAILVSPQQSFTRRDGSLSAVQRAAGPVTGLRKACHRGRREIRSSSHAVSISEPGSSGIFGPGDSRRSEQYIAQLTELAAVYSLKPYRAVATGLRGRWLLLQNDLRAGIPLLKRALEELHTKRHEMLNMEFVCDLGAGLIAIGEHQEALTLTMSAIEAQHRGGKYLYMPALFRIKGLILASRSAEDYFEAEGSLLSAIDWAKRQSATLFELKAATELAELLLKQGRMPEAYKHLGAALDRMPAGIVSPDHTRALQILSQLQSGTKAVG